MSRALDLGQLAAAGRLAAWLQLPALCALSACAPVRMVVPPELLSDSDALLIDGLGDLKPGWAVGAIAVGAKQGGWTTGTSGGFGGVRAGQAEQRYSLTVTGDGGRTQDVACYASTQVSGIDLGPSARIGVQQNQLDCEWSALGGSVVLELRRPGMRTEGTVQVGGRTRTVTTLEEAEGTSFRFPVGLRIADGEHTLFAAEPTEGGRVIFASVLPTEEREVFVAVLAAIYNWDDLSSSAGM